MRAFALDTNVILRLSNPLAPEHAVCRNAATRLAGNGWSLVTPAQALVELWVVATRPADVNGLGWTPEVTISAVDTLTSWLDILFESPEAFSRWRGLVANGVVGKRAHDARIASVLLAQGVGDILTLNVRDFLGFPGIRPHHPAAVA